MEFQDYVVLITGGESDSLSSKGSRQLDCRRNSSS